MPDFDLEDHADEVVNERPRRPAVPPIDGVAIARAPSGGRMKKLRDAGDDARRDFLVMRKAGQPPIRLVLTQAPIFQALWSLWQAKRTAGVDDPGVTAAEVSARLAEEGRPTATSSINKALGSMALNEFVRRVETRAGFRFSANLYYPSSNGLEAYAIAQVVGDGSLVQVGRTARAWRRRDNSEPLNLFQHAGLLRGWVEPAETVESA